MTLAARKIKVTIKCNASHNVPSRASFHKLKEAIGPLLYLAICILAIYYTTEKYYVLSVAFRSTAWQDITQITRLVSRGTSAD